MMKYAAVDDEGIDSPLFDTEQEVHDWIASNVLDDMPNYEYEVESFTPEQLKIIDAQPDT